MGYNSEFCDPLDGTESDIWMKLEHCGRYLFACDYLSAAGCSSALDLACADGYGAKLLANSIPRVAAADRNQEYLKKLVHSGIPCYCLDFDDSSFPADLPDVSAVVCFETIEHLRAPFKFLEKIGQILPAGGHLLLSFPNEKYERLNPDGTNRDPYHLHILSLSDVRQALLRLDYQIHFILGQPVCNNACSRQHDLREAGVLEDRTVWRAFRYDADSVCALARILAYPQEQLIDESYSYLIVAQKNA